MNLDKYPLTAGEDFTSFEFISTGPNGSIIKLVQFQKSESTNVYNLAFGDKKLTTGELDDMIVSNNGDTEKVLATVVSALYQFFTKYPQAFVIATGSTPTRTRLYKMGLTRFYTQMNLDFQTFGLIDGSFEKFEINKSYIAFLVRKKFN